MRRKPKNFLEFVGGRDHATASFAGAVVLPFAARRTSKSEVTPFALPTGDSMIGSQYSSGIRSRVNHLRVAGTEKPLASAMRSADPQSKITSRKDVGSGMPEQLGQFVLKGKPALSRDCEQALGQNVLMKHDQGRSEYERAFLARTAAARKLRYKSQEEAAQALDMTQGTYQKYESRSPLPHYLIPRFCLICGVSAEWLMTGKGTGPAIVLIEKEKRPRAKARKVKAA